jgi:DNA replication protein DnaD
VDQDMENNDKAGSNQNAIANYNGKYDANGTYSMSILELQDPVHTCFGIQLMKGSGQTLVQWEALHAQQIETKLQKVYHVSAMEVFWKQHQYTILACS